MRAAVVDAGVAAAVADWHMPLRAPSPASLCLRTRSRLFQDFFGMLMLEE